MRPNVICSLFTFGGSIVLAILATYIHDYEAGFWAAAAICFIVATYMWAAPWASAKVRAHLGSSKVPISKEIDLHQFLRFVGIDTMDPMSRIPPLQNKANDAFVKLRQLARDGNVRIRGKPGFRYESSYMSWKPAELIEPAYWRNAQIFCLDVLRANDVNNISTMPDEAMGGRRSDAPVYKWLTIIEDDIKAHFKNNEFSTKAENMQM
jgi:hypothetical protein